MIDTSGGIVQSCRSSPPPRRCSTPPKTCSCYSSRSHGGEHAPLIATICSSIKFTLITIAIAYVCGGCCELRHEESEADLDARHNQR